MKRRILKIHVLREAPLRAHAKHKRENAPREYTRDAFPHFAFALEKLAVFLLKLSTRNRVHSPADSLGRFTPHAHALKGVLLNSASPDACEPSDYLLYHNRYVKDHIPENHLS